MGGRSLRQKFPGDTEGLAKDQFSRRNPDVLLDHTAQPQQNNPLAYGWYVEVRWTLTSLPHPPTAMVDHSSDTN